MLSTLGTSKSMFKFNQSSAASITPYTFYSYSSATLPSVTTSNGFMNCQSSKSGQYIYVAHSANGLYKSSDYGTTFSLISGISGSLGNGCQRVCCSNDGSVVFLAIGVNGGNNDVFRSTNYGVNWTKISTTSSVKYETVDCDGSGTYAFWCVYGNGVFYYNGSVSSSYSDSGCGWINGSMSKDSYYIVVSGNSKAGNGTAKTIVSTNLYSNAPSWSLINNNAFDANMGICQMSYDGNTMFYTSSNYFPGVWLITNKSTSTLTTSQRLSSISQSVYWLSSTCQSAYNFAFVIGYFGTTQYASYTTNNGSSWTALTPPVSGSNYSACYSYLGSSNNIIVVVCYGLYGNNQTKGLYFISFPHS